MLCVCLLSTSCFLGAVPVAGEALAYSVLRSPKLSPQQCGMAHGPLRPALCASEYVDGILSGKLVLCDLGLLLCQVLRESVVLASLAL